MKLIHISWIGRYVALSGCVVALAGCSGTTIGANSRDTSRPALSAVSGAQRVVEDYLKAASQADGSRMYALIASSERDNETPQTLRKTAADRYDTTMKWDVLKTDETGNSAVVTVEVQGANVEPNPTKFTLSKENGEWRIVDSPELHEREKNGDIHIKF